MEYKIPIMMELVKLHISYNKDNYPLIKKPEEVVKRYEEYFEKLEQLRREKFLKQSTTG